MLCAGLATRLEIHHVCLVFQVSLKGLLALIVVIPVLLDCLGPIVVTEGGSCRG